MTGGGVRAFVLPEIYRSCAHPQSVWFEVHWRPIFNQLKAELEQVRAERDEAREDAERLMCMDYWAERGKAAEKERDALRLEVERLRGEIRRMRMIKEILYTPG